MTSIKAITQKRRQVYKPILELPYSINNNYWPDNSILSKNINQLDNLLDNLLIILKPIKDYYTLIDYEKQNNIKKTKKKEKSNDAIEEKGSGITREKPEIFNHITIGFNSTIKSLERQCSVKHLHKEKTNRDKTNDQRENKREISIDLVFVCKNDIQPQILTNHLPMLCYNASSLCGKNIKLVELPKNTIDRMSSFLYPGENGASSGSNYNYGGIIGMEASYLKNSPLVNQHNLRMLEDILLEIGNVSISWLNAHTLRYAKLNIKLLKTSAPVLLKTKQHKLQKLHTRKTLDPPLRVGS
ncbi:Pop3p ASCRUDRAFT_99083 [Ascoidea rubescens DSM 1968]|uniref:Uncharacterized protein n=1 Tax=Ascoidea rubescens DSM 1968 TaxID=1344418 RepID=A0A1D2VQF0_9ASCO|nr:hypothetical protein ASCRUDRAFT_99083 [Ascoidea rubescens DSM 1968]ODV63829.1 hypothetical protein ASCRUDRAFT_99083 [Ascoidea rubescens DSM 1968]